MEGCGIDLKKGIVNGRKILQGCEIDLLAGDLIKKEKALKQENA